MHSQNDYRVAFSVLIVYDRGTSGKYVAES